MKTSGTPRPPRRKAQAGTVSLKSSTARPSEAAGKSHNCPELSVLVARLASSEKRYRTLLDHANDAIGILSPDGVIREANCRWGEILGCAPQELIGRHIRDFAPTGQEAEFEKTYSDAVAGGPALMPPVELRKPGGGSVLMEFSQTIIEIGEERLVMAIGRDITEKARLEAQLYQAQKLEAVGQLSGGIAHDFNNILTAILGFSDMLIEGGLSEDRARESLLQIRKAGERAARLTRQLLAFSRKQAIHPKVFAVRDLVAEFEPMLRRLIPESIELRTSVRGPVGLIRIDPSQFEQVLVNLAVNAADATPAGGAIAITVSTAPEDTRRAPLRLPPSANGYLMFAVQDTGCGMDEETRRHIFEPFFTTKDVDKGTGMGLATVYGVVKQNQGEIVVESEVGHGACFTIYLPLVAGEPVATTPAPDAIAMPLATGTVLLVEDDSSVRELARTVLEAAGYRILEASDPQQGWAMACDFAGRIDLLLSDVVMPGSSGPALFERLSPLRPQMPVLYMSGYPDRGGASSGWRPGNAPFLQKPFTPATLQQNVREAIEGRSRVTP